jgi:HSP20 family molecular chaperone IbpA
MTYTNANLPTLLARSVLQGMISDFSDRDPNALVRRSTKGYPLTEIFTDGEDTVVEMALAGFSPDDIEVKTYDNTLTVEAANPATGREPTIATKNIARRSFTKNFVDTNNLLDLEGSTVDFTNGLLTIRISPKKESRAKVLFGSKSSK